MGGAWFGPLEIFVCCDKDGCGAEELVWVGNPDVEPKPDPEPLPAGWTARDGKNFCPRH